MTQQRGQTRSVELNLAQHSSSSAGNYNFGIQRLIFYCCLSKEWVANCTCSGNCILFQCIINHFWYFEWAFNLMVLPSVTSWSPDILNTTQLLTFWATFLTPRLPYVIIVTLIGCRFIPPQQFHGLEHRPALGPEGAQRSHIIHLICNHCRFVWECAPPAIIYSKTYRHGLIFTWSYLLDDLVHGVFTCRCELPSQPTCTEQTNCIQSCGYTAVQEWADSEIYMAWTLVTTGSVFS